VIDKTRRDAIARNLCARICRDDRTEDELLVVGILLEGVERGFADHGGLVLARDGRDFTDELDQELGDGLFYICARAAKRRAERLARVENIDRAIGEEVAAHHTERVEAGLRELADITAKFDTGGTEP
jgi:hypothetical protein